MDLSDANVITYESLDELNKACAQLFVEKVTEAVRERGFFSLVLAGGKTPEKLYELLASPQISEAIDWQRVFVFWGDERCVMPDDPRSNYLMAEKALLSKVPVPATNVFRMPGEFEPYVGAEIYEKDLEDFMVENEIPAEQIPVFDLVLLGLGLDGHTASLFPGSKVLDEQERLVCCVAAPDVSPAVERLTLTLPVINSSNNVWFIVSGESKIRIVQRILCGGDEKYFYPAAWVKPNGNLRWFLSI